jgi:membrane-bound lytic murein transglycosylase D
LPNRKHISIFIRAVLFALCNITLVTHFATAQNSSVCDSASQNGIPIVPAGADSILNLEVNKSSSVFTDSSASFASASYPEFTDSVYATRIMSIQKRVPLAYNDQIRRFIDMYVVYKRDLVSRMVSLSKIYYPIFDSIFARYNIPPEIENLAVVESALNPQAVSRCGATGMWQFMYYTARLYNLKMNPYLDERKDIIKATEASAQYLSDSYSEFGDWLLAIASYNCGKINVERALARSGGTTFWDVQHYLPYETRSYIPLFIAATYAMNYYNEHQINPINPNYDLCDIGVVNVDQKISLNQVAKFTKTPIDEVCFLNPSIRCNVLPDPGEGYTLKLPEDKLSAFITNKDSIYLLSRDEVARPYYSYYSRKGYLGSADGTYTIQQGDNLSTIARSFGTSVAQLKAWNGLKDNYIYSGMRLRISAVNSSIAASSRPKSNLKTTTTVASANTKVKTNQPVKAIFYTVKPGDSLWTIAKRYPGVTIDSIKQVNEYSKWAFLKPGTVLKILI